MNLTLEIPDDVAARLAESGGDLPRRALEALALEGYRTGYLGEEQVRQLLGFSSRWEVHAFFKERGMHLNYSVDDLQDDLAKPIGAKE